MRLTFLGATDTVTGSRYLVESGNTRLLVDCGMYQGVKVLRERNWKKMPELERLDAVVLTHAHLDHSGYLPRLARLGIDCPVYCSSGTAALCAVLLPDAAYLQEEDARYANKHGFSRHSPAEPLYDREDAQRVLANLQPLALHSTQRIGDLTIQLSPVGHILGACAVHIDDGNTRLVFSGDVGRQQDELMYPPEPLPRADALVVESTYGDRLHEPCDVSALLEEIILMTTGRGGSVLIPAFAVGRAQLLLLHLARLKQAGRIPSVPVFLNSPMAISATEIYQRFHRELRISSADCALIDKATRYVRSVEESIALTQNPYPSVIISASGMASGGRVLHHMKSLLGDTRNSMVFVGYQAVGTRGQAIVGGAPQVKIHGQYYPVRAQVHDLGALSAHGDYEDILTWLEKTGQPPQQVFVTHGERQAADAMRVQLRDRLGWSARVPELRERVDL
ncbi:MBL fold metallo-hydrolase [Biformimicrobium ophioploci]|uniref:MBL fold metallo-hydrolase n=1 Tax=Biformimicrobium ophioploci TaxID=3036711 RepID=A0ABQ6M056_9GAMM|nr:MBL fold metallo-hydrolase [Microbulbifer sp. NKW57]GMG87698.1 MBL fold metallo-hydrolase [Microbulbifer sp. NKW57]